MLRSLAITLRLLALETGDFFLRALDVVDKRARRRHFFPHLLHGRGRLPPHAHTRERDQTPAR